ncbi:unannotated protein [freshwater metagenome]|uniref:Unannotated protein n=1 Tax=freshwater metagenome TaxID=449393 RepID=A0A6J6AXJ6_9ZZZZ
MRITFCVSIPVADASCTLSLTARIALPSLDLCNENATDNKIIIPRIAVVKSLGVIPIGPISRLTCFEKLVNCFVRPPNRNRNKLISISDRPSDTTNCELEPIPRFVKRAKIPQLISSPKHPPNKITSGPEIRIGIFRWTLKKNAKSAPNVTISPCAKFVTPVVPITSESPTEHIAIMIPRRIPSVNL